MNRNGGYSVRVSVALIQSLIGPSDLNNLQNVLIPNLEELPILNFFQFNLIQKVNKT